MNTFNAVRTVLETAGVPVYAVVEAQLLMWSKSTSRDGPKIKFSLVDDDALAPFEVATLAKGRVAGQLFLLVAIPYDEQSGFVSEPISMPVFEGPVDFEDSDPDDLEDDLRADPPEEQPRNVRPQTTRYLPQGQVAAPSQQPAPPTTPLGPLGRLAGQFCDDAMFWKWCREEKNYPTNNQADAAEFIRGTCLVHTRRDLDCIDEAKKLFHEIIRIPYSMWRKNQTASQA